VQDAAIGDVGVGQERDAHVARARSEDLGGRAHHRHEVRVRELDALGRAGRARRVDQRDDVLRRHRAPGTLEVERRVTPTGQLVAGDRRGVLAVDQDDRLELGAGSLDAVEELHFGDDDVRRGIAEQVFDLVRARGVVDRERRRAEVHRGDVHHVELGTVREHAGERVAALQPEPCEAGSHLADHLGVLAPGQRYLTTERAQRDVVGPLGGGDLERLAERFRLQRGAAAGTGRLGLGDRHSESPNGVSSASPPTTVNAVTRPGNLRGVSA
jgi:hypothetical protein